MARRKPLWLKSDLPDGRGLKRVVRTVSSLGLNTICFEARCPNKGECFREGLVTFLILGKKCTRMCGFCNVGSSLPERPDNREPERIAAACSALDLDYAVITSVTRDDLPDGGAGHFAECIGALKRAHKNTVVEILTPDFGGDFACVDEAVSAGVDVFSHNMETVERLYPEVRVGADYRRSLGILAHVRSEFPAVLVKSGFMLGLGEDYEEVRSTLRDLSGVGCDIVTIGQYLQPSLAHLPVREYADPAVFRELGDYARDLGLVGVCGPMVRSSYFAKAAFTEARLRRQRCA